MAIDSQTPEQSTVPLGTGLPTREELLAHYPAQFTWQQLKTFVNSGDLGLLKRNKKLQARYEEWSKGIKQEYGSMVNYLLNHRLLWGKPDTLARLPTRRVIQPDELAKQDAVEDQSSSLPKNRQGVLPPIPENSPKYFTAETPPELVSIIMNDWPYSVPPEIEHVLIWIRLPLIPDDLPASIAPRIAQDGLWGFTGNDSPPPSPSLLPLYLPALSDWGVTMEKLVRSPRGTDEEEELVKQAGSQIDTYVRRHWPEDQWETAWFSNPPRLQSVPGLAHIHVFARYKGN